MKSVVFTVDGEPVPKARPRFTRYGRTYTPKASAEWERKVKDAAEAALAKVPDFPAEAPVEVRLSFFLAIPDSWPKWKRAAAVRGQVAHMSKPDADNLAKAVLDGMNGVLFKDDAQAVKVAAYKQYAADGCAGVVAHVFALPFPISSTTKRNPAKAKQEAVNA